MFCPSNLTTSSHTVFKYMVERSETLRMILAVGIEKRQHALYGLSCTSWINWKIFSDSTGSPGLDSIFLPVSPIKRKWWWKICCETLLDVVTAITSPATVTVKNLWLSLNPQKKFDVLGHSLAQRVQCASHLPRLYSGPGFDSRPGSLFYVSLPLSLSLIPCQIFSCSINEAIKRLKKI